MIKGQLVNKIQNLKICVRIHSYELRIYVATVEISLSLWFLYIREPRFQLGLIVDLLEQESWVPSTKEILKN